MVIKSEIYDNFINKSFLEVINELINEENTFLLEEYSILI